MNIYDEALEPHKQILKNAEATLHLLECITKQLRQGIVYPELNQVAADRINRMFSYENYPEMHKWADRATGVDYTETGRPVLLDGANAVFHLHTRFYDIYSNIQLDGPGINTEDIMCYLEIFK